MNGPLTRQDFPSLPPGQTQWVLHSRATTIRIDDTPHTDWPGVIEFLTRYGKNGWEFCTHAPTC